MRANKVISMLALASAGILPAGVCTAAPHLTAVTLYSLNTFAIYDGVNSWDTVPTNAVPNVWLGGTTSPNGPSDADAAINITLSVGSGFIGIYCSPGSLLETYYGINLFFNNSTTPQISGYQPASCAAGPPSAYSGTSQGLSGTVAAAGTLRAVVEGFEIDLDGYLLSPPGCALLDTCSPYTWTTDGTNDFTGTFLLTVSAVPKLSIVLTSTNTAVVSWPSPSSGFKLQQTTNSASLGDWSDITSGIADNGTTKSFLVNPPAGNQFYRLLKP
jgi:hypothetical protein